MWTTLWRSEFQNLERNYNLFCLTDFYSDGLQSHGFRGKSTTGSDSKTEQPLENKGTKFYLMVFPPLYVLSRLTLMHMISRSISNLLYRSILNDFDRFLSHPHFLTKWRNYMLHLIMWFLPWFHLLFMNACRKSTCPLVNQKSLSEHFGKSTATFWEDCENQWTIN